MLVVSHDRYFLDSVCTRIWELRGKTITTYRGNYSAYLPQREAADERLQKQHDADVEKAAKLQDYIDRNLVRASTTKMAQSRRKQLEKLEITEAPQAEAHQADHVGACIGQVVQCVRRNGHTAKQGAHRKLARKQQHIADNPGDPGQLSVSFAHGGVGGILIVRNKAPQKKGRHGIRLFQVCMLLLYRAARTEASEKSGCFFRKGDWKYRKIVI